MSRSIIQHYMDIIQTVNVGEEFEKLKNRLEIFHNIGITKIRINFNKYNLETEMEKISNVLEILCQFKEYYYFQFDIPYPFSKSRILKFNVKENLVREGERYDICVDEANYSNKENSILLSKVTRINKSEILYFGDGQGAFEIISRKKNKVNVKALSTFEIYYAKSILFGFKHMQDYIGALIELVESKCDKCDFSYVLSLVESSNDIISFRSMLNKRHPIIAKIETEDSIRNIKDIIDNSDEIMLARGDMAILNDYSNLFLYLKYIVKKAIEKNKKVHLATDVLGSMKKGHYLPSRSDIVDISYMLQLGCNSIVLGNVEDFSVVERQMCIIKDIYKNLKHSSI